MSRHQRVWSVHLGKPRVEAWTTEIGYTIADIDHVLAHLPGWMRTRRVPTPLMFQPATSQLIHEPLGVATVIAPWNYPVQLLLMPVVAALAAGNTVVAKPSEVPAATDEVLGRLLRGLQEPAIQVVQGGVEQTTALLEQRVDSILYTGNATVGRIVARAAAENLTPVTLELGGKSPAIVTSTADIEVAARRIAWGKWLNAGQTCIAPDYVLCDERVAPALIDGLRRAVHTFYGDDPQRSADYARVVNDKHFQRLLRLMQDGDVVFGGQADPDTRYLAPTVVRGVDRQHPVMQEEIFGPVLPLLTVRSLGEATALIRDGDKPLALYLFAGDTAAVDEVLADTSSGGVTVNGTLLHVSNPHLPFGGVGESGTGAYHGEKGFQNFSHQRAVHRRSTRLDPPVLYPPYTRRKEAVLRRALLAGDPRTRLAGLLGQARG